MYSLGYFIIILIAILVEIYRKKYSRIDSFSIFLLGFFLSYLIPCFLWSLLPELFQEKLPYNLYYNAASTPEVFFTIALSYTSFCLMYLFFKKSGSILSLGTESINYNNIQQRTRFFIIFSLFVFLIFIMILLSGGLTEYISSSLEARHNKTEFGLAGYLNYLLTAALFLFISAVYLWSEKEYYQIGLFSKIIIIITLVFVSISLLARGGRSSIVNVLIYVMVFLYFTGKIRINVKTIFLTILFSFISLFIIYYLRKMSANLIAGNYMLDNIDIVTFLEDIGSVLIYPFQYFVHYIFVIVEFFKQPDAYYYPRLGSDIISGLVVMIPGMNGQSLGLPELPDIVSQNIMGKYNGYIPPGWIGWSLMDGNYIFLIVKLSFSALICSFIDKSYPLISKKTSIGDLNYFLIILFVISILFEVTSMNLFRGRIGEGLFFILYFCLPKLRLGKIKLYKRRF